SCSNAPFVPARRYSHHCERGATIRTSILRLAHGLIHIDHDRHVFSTAAEACAAHRRSAEIIQSDGHPQMGVSCANSVGGIETHPAEMRDMRFRPGVTGLLLHDAVGAMEIAADIARRDLQAARGGNENV